MDNRIIFIQRRVPSLGSTALIAQIKNGESFLTEDTLTEYYKHHITGEIIKTNGGAGGSATAQLPFSTVYDNDTESYKLGFVNDRNPTLSAYSTTIRFITTEDLIPPKTLKITVGSNTYDVLTANGDRIPDGSITADMMLDAVFDGIAFRLSGGISGSGGGGSKFSIPALNIDGWIKAFEFTGITSSSKGTITLVSSNINGAFGGSALLTYIYANDGEPNFSVSAAIQSGAPFRDIAVQKISESEYTIWLKAPAGTSFDAIATINPGTLKLFNPANVAVADLPVGDFYEALLSTAQNISDSGIINISIPDGSDITTVDLSAEGEIFFNKLQILMNGIRLKKTVDYTYNTDTKILSFTSPITSGNELEIIP